MAAMMQTIAAPKMSLKAQAGSSSLKKGRMSLSARQSSTLSGSGRSLTLSSASRLNNKATAAAPATFKRAACVASMATTTASTPRVVLDSLPRIYVYDHCPFCVRVRLALGLKNIKHEAVFLANDDVKTPTNLIGKKIAPIMERPDIGMIMGESLDIIAYFDENPEFGPTGTFAKSPGRSDIKAWQKDVKDMLRLLHRPRYMMASLPEFQQRDSRDYFVSGHPVPPYDKPEWKDPSFGLERQWALYEEAMDQSEELIPQINQKLKKLDAMIACDQYCTVGGLSYDDIDLWARLRSLTLVKGVQFPPKLAAYMKNLSEAGDIPLYYNMAC